ISASTIVSAIGTYTWGSSSQMVADVQDWLDAPSANFGWIVIGEESTPTTAKRFDSRENPTPANRPKLTIVFSPPLTDCNHNGIPDAVDIATGHSRDCNANGIPDECETDSDGDGTIDACDGCPNDPLKTSPGACGCGVPDTDSDG